MSSMPPAPLLRRIVAAVVGVAAVLLIVDIALAMLVARRSRSIREGLESLRGTTADLRLAPEISGELERMTRALEAIRRARAA